MRFKVQNKYEAEYDTCIGSGNSAFGVLAVHGLAHGILSNVFGRRVVDDIYLRCVTSIWHVPAVIVCKAGELNFNAASTVLEYPSKIAPNELSKLLLKSANVLRSVAELCSLGCQNSYKILKDSFTREVGAGIRIHNEHSSRPKSLARPTTVEQKSLNDSARESPTRDR